MAYASIDPRVHDDEKFTALDDTAQAVWIYLLTGHESLSGPPGLIVIGIAGLAEARRRSTQEVGAALDRLRAAGMVEVDPLHRLIRIPKAPFYRAPGNPNVVRGWYRRWTSLPNSQLKYDHLESMREALAEADVSASTRAMFDQTFGRDLARRVTGRPSLQLVQHPGGQATQVSLPLGEGPTEVVSPIDDISVDSPADSEESSGIACSSSGYAAGEGNGSEAIREWFPNGRYGDPERIRIRRSGTDPDPSRDPTECALAPAPPEPYVLPTPEPEPEPEVNPVPRMALALRTWRLERVLALQAAGIGATLPPPSIHDEVARGEPDRLVRSWLLVAEVTAVDAEELVRRRSTQLLDALEASARRDKSIAGLRETVCYSPKVVDWALTTEVASVGRPRATSSALHQRQPDPVEPPVMVPAEERAAAARQLRDHLARGMLAPIEITQGASACP